MTQQQQKCSIANPLFANGYTPADGRQPLSEAENTRLAIVPMMMMQEKGDVEGDVRTLRKRAWWFTLFVFVQMAITLGVVVFALLFMRNLGIVDDGASAARLVENGNLGGLGRPSAARTVHMGSSDVRGLPLHSGNSDAFFKALDIVDMEFSTKHDTAGSKRNLHNAARSPGMDEGNTLARDSDASRQFHHAVSAMVHGFTRKPCDTCATGSEVLIHTDLGRLHVVDGHILPYLDSEKFKGLDVDSLRQKVTAEARRRLQSESGADTAAGLLGGWYFKGFGNSSDHYSAGYSHNFDAGAHAHTAFDIGADYYKKTHDIDVHMKAGSQW